MRILFIRQNFPGQFRHFFLAHATRNDELIPFANRNLEPYRSFHTIMRALPEMFRQRLMARVLIVGGVTR